MRSYKIIIRARKNYEQHKVLRFNKDTMSLLWLPVHFMCQFTQSMMKGSQSHTIQKKKFSKLWTLDDFHLNEKHN